MGEWSIESGQQLKRLALHEMYGGRRQGGIGPSRVSDNVLLFTDHTKGQAYGYFDGWGNDGAYHYAGEGQVGDQKMTQGNLAILNHRQDGRALRLFQYVATGIVEYVGEFALDEDAPWYRTDAPDAEGQLRSVIMFRLKPTHALQHLGARLRHTPQPRPEVTSVDVEQHHTERALVDPARGPYEAERREATLVRDFVEHLRRQGHQVVRQRISPRGALQSLYTDVFDVTDGLLVEAKGTVTREAIRAAIGQLFDYRRFITPEPSLALLVPTQPQQDLLDLCASVQIKMIWPEGDEYVTHGA